MHPYTRLLIGSVPRMVGAEGPDRGDGEGAPDGGASRDLAAVRAQVAGAATRACRFADRCPSVVAGCAAEPELLADPRDPTRQAACAHVAGRSEGAIR